MIHAVGADDYRAELLNVDPGAPLLSVMTTAYLENGEIIEISLSHYRADRYEYRTDENAALSDERRATKLSFTLQSM